MQDNPKLKRPGTLIIINGRNIQLSLERPFHLPSAARVGSKWDLHRIHGQVEGGKSVILECHKDAIIDKDKLDILANTAFIGVQHEEKEEIKINTFYFSIDGLAQWLGPCGISHTRLETHTTVIKAELQGTEYKLKDGWSVKIIAGYRHVPQRFPIIKEKLIQKEYIKISSENSRPYSEFFEFCQEIYFLFNIIFDGVPGMGNISVTSKGITEDYIEAGRKKTVPTEIFVYDSKMPPSEKKVEIYLGSLLFDFKNMKDRFGKFIEKWRSFYSECSIVAQLYSVSKAKGLFIHVQFLLLFQALEVYSRTRFVSQKMKKRKSREETRELIGNAVGHFFNTFGLSDDEIWKRFTGRIVDVRNFYTHHNLESCKMPDSGPDKITELISLSCSIEMFIQVFVLEDIEFGNQEVSAMLEDRNTVIGGKYHQMLKYLNEFADLLPESY